MQSLPYLEEVEVFSLLPLCPVDDNTERFWKMVCEVCSIVVTQCVMLKKYAVLNGARKGMRK